MCPHPQLDYFEKTMLGAVYVATGGRAQARQTHGPASRWAGVGFRLGRPGEEKKSESCDLGTHGSACLAFRDGDPSWSQVKACLRELADKFSTKRGMDRREFLKTSSGIAATFLALNSVYGKVLNVAETEAADFEMANDRAGALRQQFIFDVETYFLRDDYPIESLGEVLKRGLIGYYPFSEPDMRRNMKRDLGVELMPFEDFVGHLHADMNFDNYVRQIHLNSDTKLTVLNGIPFDDDSWEFLNNAQIAEATKMVNMTAGQTRMLSYGVVTPSQPGWMEEVDRAVAERPPASCTTSATRFPRRRNIPSGSMTRS